MAVEVKKTEHKQADYSWLPNSKNLGTESSYILLHFSYLLVW